MHATLQSSTTDTPTSGPASALTPAPAPKMPSAAAAGLEEEDWGGGVGGTGISSPLSRGWRMAFTPPGSLATSSEQGMAFGGYACLVCTRAWVGGQEGGDRAE